MFDNLILSINRDFILSRVTEEQIFTKYLGIEPSDKGQFTNPKRDDDDAGCSFYVDERGKWIFKDFAGGFHWDCFNVVEYEHNCSFKEALIRIAIDFNLVDGSKIDSKFIVTTRREKTKIELRIKRRSWTKEDYDFWLRFGITDDILYQGNVNPVSHVWFSENGKLRLAYVYTKGDPAYVYDFFNHNYKIYLPFRSKGRKFLQSTSKLIQGYNILPDVGKNLLWTKSYKDVLAIRKYSHEFDLHSLAPMSETVVITPEQFSDVYNRFDNQATLFDFDRAGIKLMRKYQEIYKLPFYMFGKSFKLQGIKDFADHREIKGDDETRRLIEKYINNPIINTNTPF